MKKIKYILMLIILIGVTGCSSSSASLEISGSTSVAPLMNKLAEQYSKSNDIQININADGSSAGINAVMNGVSEIGMSSRELDEKESKELDVAVLAIDAIGIIQNEKNTVKSLSLQQLQDIYRGKIKNWKEVGGIDLPIVVVSREDGSGTRVAFEEKVELLDDNKRSYVNDIRPVIVNSNGAVIENVKQKEGAIGYLSIGSIEDDVKIIAIDNITPNKKSILSNKYVLARNFNLVYKELSDEGKLFLEYLKSDKAKKIIEEEGYIVGDRDE